MGDLAWKKGLSERTRQVGKLIAADHRVLDDDVIRVAGRFGHRLPTEGTVDQKEWMKELNEKTGKDFDEAFAQRRRREEPTVDAHRPVRPDRCHWCRRSSPRHPRRRLSRGTPRKK